MKPARFKKTIFVFFVVMSTALVAQAKIILPEVGSKWTGYNTGLSGKGTVEVVSVSEVSKYDIRIKLEGQLFQRQVNDMEFKRTGSMQSPSLNGKVSIFTSFFKCEDGRTGLISFEVYEPRGKIVRFDYESCHSGYRSGYGTVIQEE